MRVLCCGSRTFSDREQLEAFMSSFALNLGEQLTIIEGGAQGADRLAGEWADEHAAERITFPADWDTHGRKAGPIRNQQMLDDGAPELVVAFIDKPLNKSRGTQDMTQRAYEAGIPVIIVQLIGDEDVRDSL